MLEYFRHISRVKTDLHRYSKQVSYLYQQLSSSFPLPFQFLTSGELIPCKCFQVSSYNFNEKVIYRCVCFSSNDSEDNINNFNWHTRLPNLSSIEHVSDMIRQRIATMNQQQLYCALKFVCNEVPQEQ